MSTVRTIRDSFAILRSAPGEVFLEFLMQRNIRHDLEDPQPSSDGKTSIVTSIQVLDFAALLAVSKTTRFDRETGRCEPELVVV